MVSRSLFAGLVDDAALFPPGNAPMDRALIDHAEHRASPYGDLVGPFLFPASRTVELREALAADASLDVALVVDVTGDGAHSALRGVAEDERLSLVAVEAPYSKLGDDAVAVGRNLSRLPAVVGYLEAPRTDLEVVLDLVAASGWHGVKYRTGGTDAEAFPTEAELAAFLVAATARSIPFKLTAGLHSALRHRAEDTGFEHHGVLNVLVGTRVAQQVGAAPEVEAVLAETDAARLVEFARDWDDAACADVRRAFRSFGCCGVTDPITDLEALGLVEGAR